MFGKWVVINLGEGIECRVFVCCTPTTPEGDLQWSARAILSSRLTQDAHDRFPRQQNYDTGHPDPMFIVKESRTNSGG